MTQHKIIGCTSRVRLDEAAKELGLSTRHVLRFIESGELPAKRIQVTVMRKALVWDISEDAIQKLKAKRKEYYDTQPDWIKAKAKVDYEEMPTE